MIKLTLPELNSSSRIIENCDSSVTHCVLCEFVTAYRYDVINRAQRWPCFTPESNIKRIRAIVSLLSDCSFGSIPDTEALDV